MLLPAFAALCRSYFWTWQLECTFTPDACRFPEQMKRNAQHGTSGVASRGVVRYWNELYKNQATHGGSL